MTFPAVILAGGQARRMDGADKPFCVLGGKALLSHVISRIRPQVPAVVISGNGDLSRFSCWDLPVVPDAVATDLGPLAGLLAGIYWAKSHSPAAECVVLLPADVPFLPLDYVQRLSEKRQETDADVVMASSGGRVHFAAAVWPVYVADELHQTLSSCSSFRVEAFANRFQTAIVEFDTAPFDPFHNVNLPEDLAAAEALLPTVQRGSAHY
jgi:molybdopterin-guanine dinucleotide biosynthesis protein A